MADPLAAGPLAARRACVLEVTRSTPMPRDRSRSASWLEPWAPVPVGDKVPGSLRSGSSIACATAVHIQIANSTANGMAARGQRLDGRRRGGAGVSWVAASADGAGADDPVTEDPVTDDPITDDPMTDD